MTSAKNRIPFFTDNDVADAVGDVLIAAGHPVIRLREVMLTDSPDPVVAAVCREQGLVLLTHNIRHFKAIVKEFEVTSAQADRLCRIELGCQQYLAAERIKVELSLVNLVWAGLGRQKHGLRIFIGDKIVRVHR